MNLPLVHSPNVRSHTSRQAARPLAPPPGLDHTARMELDMSADIPVYQHPPGSLADSPADGAATRQSSVSTNCVSPPSGSLVMFTSTVRPTAAVAHGREYYQRESKTAMVAGEREAEAEGDAGGSCRAVHGAEPNEAACAHTNGRSIATIFDFQVLDCNRELYDLTQHKGCALLLCNIACRCKAYSLRGFTALTAMHRRYHSAGLRILAFPCSQFDGGEEVNEEEIAEAVPCLYPSIGDIDFDVMARVDVNGDHALPLFKFLKTSRQAVAGKDEADITSSFTYFFVGREGVPVARLPPTASLEEIDARVQAVLRSTTPYPSECGGDTNTIVSLLPPSRASPAVDGKGPSQRAVTPGTGSISSSATVKAPVGFSTTQEMHTDSS